MGTPDINLETHTLTYEGEVVLRKFWPKPYCVSIYTGDKFRKPKDEDAIVSNKHRINYQLPIEKIFTCMNMGMIEDMMGNKIKINNSYDYLSSKQKAGELRIKHRN